MWNGMPEDHVHARGDEVAADGNRLLAHPLGGDADRRHVGQVVAQPAFEHDLGGRLQQARVVHAASHVQHGRDADRPRRPPGSPGPASSSAASGVSMPALAEAMAAQPVLSTMHSRWMSSRGQRIDVGVGLRPADCCSRRCPTMPLMRPWMMASLSGRKEARKVPPSMYLMAATLKPATSGLRGLGDGDLARIAVLEVGDGPAEQRLGAVQRVGLVERQVRRRRWSWRCRWWRPPRCDRPARPRAGWACSIARR